MQYEVIPLAHSKVGFSLLSLFLFAPLQFCTNIHINLKAFSGCSRARLLIILPTLIFWPAYTAMLCVFESNLLYSANSVLLQPGNKLNFSRLSYQNQHLRGFLPSVAESLPHLLVYPRPVFSFRRTCRF